MERSHSVILWFLCPIIAYWYFILMIFPGHGILKVIKLHFLHYSIWRKYVSLQCKKLKKKCRWDGREHEPEILEAWDSVSHSLQKIPQRSRVLAETPQTLSKLYGSESHNLKINHKDNFAAIYIIFSAEI